jgi:hypothetical protein
MDWFGVRSVYRYDRAGGRAVHVRAIGWACHPAPVAAVLGGATDTRQIAAWPPRRSALSGGTSEADAHRCGRSEPLGPPV